MKPSYNFGTAIKMICTELRINTGSDYNLNGSDYKNIYSYLNKGGHGIAPKIADMIKEHAKIEFKLPQYNPEDTNAREIAKLAYVYSMLKSGIDVWSMSSADGENDERILTEIFGY